MSLFHLGVRWYAHLMCSGLWCYGVFGVPSCTVFLWLRWSAAAVKNSLPCSCVQHWHGAVPLSWMVWTVFFHLFLLEVYLFYLHDFGHQQWILEIVDVCKTCTFVWFLFRVCSFDRIFWFCCKWKNLGLNRTSIVLEKMQKKHGIFFVMLTQHSVWSKQANAVNLFLMFCGNCTFLFSCFAHIFQNRTTWHCWLIRTLVFLLASAKRLQVAPMMHVRRWI